MSPAESLEIPTRGNRGGGGWRNRTPSEYLRAAWHELRWRVASGARLSEWTRRELELGDWYWLFVLGLNNSGTTLVKNILRSHPRIRSLRYEGQRMTDALPHPAKLGMRLIFANYPAIFRWTEESDPRPAHRAKYDWARHYPDGPGILLQKSPPDAVRSRWLQHNFRPCRFLAIVRSPYAVCEGICRRTEANLEAAAHHWRRGNAILFDDIDHLRRCVWFRYEDLCADGAGHLERFCRFLDLPEPFDETILEETTAHSIEGFTSGLRNLNPKSLDRLTERDIATINEIAGPVMERVGYEPL